MGAQIRTWDKREQDIDGAIVLPDDDASLAVDRLELILQLRDLQQI